MDGALLYEGLWRNALGVIPLVVAIALLCRFMPMRASTRHTLWTVALLSLFIPPIMPRIDVAGWFAASPETTEIADDAALTPALTDTPRTAQRITPDPLQYATPRKTLETPLSAPVRSESPRYREMRPTREAKAIDQPYAPFGEQLRSERSWNDVTLTKDSPVRFAHRPSEPFNSRQTLARNELAETKPPATFTRGETLQPVILDEPIVLAGPAATDASPFTVVTTPLTTYARSIFQPFFERETYAPWILEARAVRDAFIALPPFPAPLWLAGAALIAMIAGIRIAMHRRFIARALPASVRVQMMVEECADSFGLRRCPTTYMVLDRVSPMIWCGASPKLILPLELWRELDDAGRRAVVHHELAHLKRRDHWLRWAELAVGCVYWWHPMVWWVRKKLREEADNCCDAWVTALLPTERRAYATALLRTKAYLNDTTTTPGPVGLGVTTATAKRFARRLTMVMTHRNKPHLSVTGLLLAAVLGVTAMIATPIWACPPDHHDKSPEEHAKLHGKAPKAPKAEKAPKADKAPKAPKAPKAAKQKQSTESGSTFEQFLEERGGDDNLDARLRELEQRLNHAMRNVEGLLTAPDAPEPPSPSAAPPAATLRALGYAQDAGATFDRDYKLSKDKLAKLTKLMSRDDVPVLIIPGDDKITVRGTAREHMIFGAFVSIINPVKGSSVVSLSDGKLDDLSDLMILSSVPIRVRPADEHLTVYGTDLELRVFNEFAKLIDPEGFKSKSPKSGDASGANAQAQRVNPAPEPKVRQQIEARAHAAMSKARALHVEADRLEALRAEIEEKVAAIEAEAEEIEEKADAVADEADEMVDRAEDLAAEAEETEANDARYRMVAEAGALRAEADARRVSAHALLAQAEAVMRQAEVLEAQAEAMEDRADALRDQADEIENTLTDHLDSLEASLNDRYEKLNHMIQQQAAQIEQIIESYDKRLGQEVDGRLAQQLRQQLSVIDRAAEQRVVVRNASNH